MTVGIDIHGVTTEIGPGAILHALCSTIARHLEPAGWGTRFPTVMNRLYKGRLDAKHARAAYSELDQIKRELEQVPRTDVVWDIEDPSLDPPWGKDVGPHMETCRTTSCPTQARI